MKRDKQEDQLGYFSDPGKGDGGMVQGGSSVLR